MSSRCCFSEKTREATARIINSILQARVPETNFLRDSVVVPDDEDNELLEWWGS